MDNYLDLFNDVNKAVYTAHSVTKMLSFGGFHLTKWISNSSFILTSLPTSDISPKIVDLDFNELPIERALGIIWDTKSNLLKVKEVSKTFPCTKGGLLSCVSSIFDPLRIVNPSVLEAKVIIQELWKRNTGWDTEVPNDLKQRWNNWKNSLDDIKKIETRRWYGFTPNLGNLLELHIFADSSSKAYVSYLRVISSNSIIASKSRLAPIRENLLTIPKLELQAAVIASRMNVTLINSLDLVFDSIYLWTDSKTVMQYITNDNSKYSPYVMHRVNEIKLNTAALSWRYIPGHLNPADDTTRPLEFKELNQNCRWFNGPEFFKEDLFEWPLEKKTFNNIIIPSMEETPEKNKTTLVLKWEHFSSWSKLIYHVAALLKIKNNWLLWKQGKTDHINSKSFNLQDLKQAVKEICKLAQYESLPREYQTLSLSKPLPKNSNILSLNPIFLNELILVGGTLKHADVPFNSKHQIILDKSHYICKLIIENIHRINMHVGREQCLSILKNQFWIPNCRGLIKNILSNCFHCKRENKPFKTPFMSDIPKERLANNCKPFSHTAVDFFGPISVKLSRKTRANSLRCFIYMLNHQSDTYRSM